MLDPDLPAPSYAHASDAGLDLRTRIDCILEPGERTEIPTGVAIALPVGYVAFVVPRSGLAARVGLGLVNAPGTIDAGYRGEIRLIAVNHDPSRPIHLSRGDRCAQLVIQAVARARLLRVPVLPDSDRGEAGFGSTGLA